MARLVVWLAGRRVGDLIRKENGNLQFRYALGYDGPPVSQALPRQDEAHGHKLVRAVFGGLLPEGDVREALARNLGVSAENDYRLLEAVGGDVAGAISLLPDGVEPPVDPSIELLDDERLAVLLDRLPRRPLAADASEGIRLSLAGAQSKLPVIVGDDGRIALPTNTAAPTTHILKPEPARFPGLVDNEAFCMSLASACEFSVAAVEKARTAWGKPFLIVERYDRDLTADPIGRIHREDFCQALGVPPDRKYQQEGGPTIAASAALVRRCTAVPALELPRLLSAFAFNWVVGNCDAHGKNHSLLYALGGPTLAPLYDVVSTVVYGELTSRLAMSIGARQLDEVGAGAWVALVGQAGFRPAFVTMIVSELLDRAAVEAAALVRMRSTRTTRPTRSTHESKVSRGVGDRVGPRVSRNILTAGRSATLTA
jgi:serine/threonine-protein kinase HipA